MALLDGIGSLGGGLSVIDKLKDIFPTYEEETTVIIQGAPQSSNDDLFNQAVAIAFGVTRSAVSKWLPTPYVAEAQYDLMHKSCTVVLRHIYNGIFSQNQIAAPFLLDRFFTSPPENNMSGSPPSGVWLNLIRKAAQLAPDAPTRAAAVKLNGVLDDKNTVLWGSWQSIRDGKPALKANGVSLVETGRNMTFTEKLVLAAISPGCEATDAWKQARDQKTVTKPGLPDYGSNLVTDTTGNVIPGGTLTASTYVTLISQESVEAAVNLTESIESKLKNT